VVGSRQTIDAPSFTTLPFGLLTVVEQPPAPDHWQGGVTWAQKCIFGGSLGNTTYDPCTAVTGTGSAPTPPTKAKSLSSQARGATSFTVVVEFDCPPIGNDSGQATQSVQSALAAAEPWQVERAFWTGQAGGQNTVFPHLASAATANDPDGILLQTAATVVTGVSGDLLNAATALGLIEDALADCYGGIGVIHVPTIALPTLDAYGLLQRNGPVLYTANGNKVAVGSGYAGTAPDGTARTGNSSWIYGTGNVFMLRGQPNVYADPTQSFDRSTNTRKMIAERTVLLGWDCCHFAAQMSLGVPKGT
jgi:hypothetical protein